MKISKSKSLHKSIAWLLSFTLCLSSAAPTLLLAQGEISANFATQNEQAIKLATKSSAEKPAPAATFEDPTTKFLSGATLAPASSAAQPPTMDRTIVSSKRPAIKKNLPVTISDAVHKVKDNVAEFGANIQNAPRGAVVFVIATRMLKYDKNGIAQADREGYSKKTLLENKSFEGDPKYPFSGQLVFLQPEESGVYRYRLEVAAPGEKPVVREIEYRFSIKWENSELEAQRAALLDKVDTAKKNTETKIAALQKKLNALLILIPQQIAQLDHDVAEGDGKLRQSILLQLNELASATGLSPETRDEIQKYLEETQTYLDAGLAEKVSKYKVFLQQQISQTKATLGAYIIYQKQLAAYRLKVVNAKTVVELNQLESQFPALIIPKFPDFRAKDPRPELLERIAKGRGLIQSAKKEIYLSAQALAGVRTWLPEGSAVSEAYLERNKAGAFVAIYFEYQGRFYRAPLVIEPSGVSVLRPLGDYDEDGKIDVNDEHLLAEMLKDLPLTPAENEKIFVIELMRGGDAIFARANLKKDGGDNVFLIVFNEEAAAGPLTFNFMLGVDLDGNSLLDESDIAIATVKLAEIVRVATVLANNLYDVSGDGYVNENDTAQVETAYADALLLSASLKPLVVALLDQNKDGMLSANDAAFIKARLESVIAAFQMIFTDRRARLSKELPDIYAVVESNPYAVTFGDAGEVSVELTITKRIVVNSDWSLKLAHPPGIYQDSAGVFLDPFQSTLDPSCPEPPYYHRYIVTNGLISAANYTDTGITETNFSFEGNRVSSVERSIAGQSWHLSYSERPDRYGALRNVIAAISSATETYEYIYSDTALNPDQPSAVAYTPDRENPADIRRFNLDSAGRTRVVESPQLGWTDHYEYSSNTGANTLTVTRRDPAGRTLLLSQYYTHLYSDANLLDGFYVPLAREVFENEARIERRLYAWPSGSERLVAPFLSYETYRETMDASDANRVKQVTKFLRDAGGRWTGLERHEADYLMTQSLNSPEPRWGALLSTTALLDTAHANVVLASGYSEEVSFDSESSLIRQIAQIETEHGPTIFTIPNVMLGGTAYTAEYRSNGTYRIFNATVNTGYLANHAAVVIPANPAMPLQFQNGKIFALHYNAEGQLTSLDEGQYDNFTHVSAFPTRRRFFNASGKITGELTAEQTASPSGSGLLVTFQTISYAGDEIDAGEYWISDVLSGAHYIWSDIAYTLSEVTLEDVLQSPYPLNHTKIYYTEGLTPAPYQPLPNLTEFRSFTVFYSDRGASASVEYIKVHASGIQPGSPGALHAEAYYWVKGGIDLIHAARSDRNRLTENLLTDDLYVLIPQHVSTGLNRGWTVTMDGNRRFKFAEYTLVGEFGLKVYTGKTAYSDPVSDTIILQGFFFPLRILVDQNGMITLRI